MKRLIIHGPHGNIVDMEIPNEGAIHAENGIVHVTSEDKTLLLAHLPTANLIITPIPEKKVEE